VSAPSRFFAFFRCARATHVTQPPASAGTGKTLCLLCAALGWREAHMARAAASVAGNTGDDGDPGRDRDATSARPRVDEKDPGERNAGSEIGETQARAFQKNTRGPLIIYASRTHSQLAQVIKELKTTRYRPRMAVIGSRQQMCVHKEVKHLRGARQQNACLRMTESRTCAHRNEVDRFVRGEPDYGKSVPVDIEDLTQLGARGHVGNGCGPCPYYLSRDMASRADVLFMPYNYLIDPKLRDALGKKINWRDAVVLFDEAHNVESACAEASSFELSAATLACAIREAQEAFEVAAAEEERESALTGASGDEAADGKGVGNRPLRFNARGRGEDDGFGGAGERLGVNGVKRHEGVLAMPKRKALEYKQLRGVLLALETKISQEMRASSNGGSSAPNSRNSGTVSSGKEIVEPCSYFFDFLAALKIDDVATIPVTRHDIDAITRNDDDTANGSATGVTLPKYISSAQLLMNVMRDAVSVLALENASFGAKSKSRRSAFGLADVADALEKAFLVKASAQTESFRVRIGPPDVRFDGASRAFASAGATAGGATAVSGTRTNGADRAGGPTLSFLCFAPGIAMKALKEKGARCVVLTSGTLSPMNSFALELLIPFPVRLENPHVVGPDQVWGGVVPVGPTGKTLNSSYRFRDSEAYKTELGNVVVNFSRIVPDGLLVFFPSYGTMRSCIECWRGHGNPSIWERIYVAKHAVVEPSDKSEFMAAFAEFNDALGLAVGGRRFADDENGAGAARAGETARHRGGAVFFAVCRGKVSEGIDFPDKAGRAVILTGIPYAPKADAKVRLKRGFLDDKIVAAHSASGGNKDARSGDAQATRLSGEAWYSQTAMRAVNQALGRVIRHRHDFGAVLLCDERFRYADVRNQLSVWLRPAIQSFDAFGPAAAQLSRFFKRHAGISAKTNEKDAPGAGSTIQPRAELKGAGVEAVSGATAGERSHLGIPKQFRTIDPDLAPRAYPRSALFAGESSGTRGAVAASARVSARASARAAATPAAAAGTAGTTGTATADGFPGQPSLPKLFETSFAAAAADARDSPVRVDGGFEAPPPVARDSPVRVDGGFEAPPPVAAPSEPNLRATSTSNASAGRRTPMSTRSSPSPRISSLRMPRRTEQSTSIDYEMLDSVCT
jgi:regulator of telomere elongation helicase 1